MTEETVADATEAARAVLRAEARALDTLADRIGGDFVTALRLLEGCRGRVLVTGLGKSGHAGRKMAATFASTNTPSFFFHAGEALHGDAGVLTPDDVLIAITNSGTTPEVVSVAELAADRGIPVVAITNAGTSPLSDVARVTLRLHLEREADPLGLAPTSSVVATLGLGDALAVALMRRRGDGPDAFARHHPGGALGRRLEKELP